MPEIERPRSRRSGARGLRSAGDTDPPERHTTVAQDVPAAHDGSAWKVLPARHHNPRDRPHDRPLRQRARFSAHRPRRGRAGAHEEAARELAGLRDDDAGIWFADLVGQQRHLSTLAGVLCATALCDDDFTCRRRRSAEHHSHRRRTHRRHRRRRPSRWLTAGLPSAGSASRPAVGPGRAVAHRAGARAQRRGWELYWARAELETAAATWMRGDQV